jgi:hypothetical protein
MTAEPSLTINQTEIFQQLESYPWDKDAEFQVRPVRTSESSVSLGIKALLRWQST